MRTGSVLCVLHCTLIGCCGLLMPRKIAGTTVRTIRVLPSTDINLFRRFTVINSYYGIHRRVLTITMTVVCRVSVVHALPHSHRVSQAFAKTPDNPQASAAQYSAVSRVLQAPPPSCTREPSSRLARTLQIAINTVAYVLRQTVVVRVHFLVLLIVPFGIGCPAFANCQCLPHISGGCTLSTGKDRSASSTCC